jgi:hypothetical protein
MHFAADNIQRNNIELEYAIYMREMTWRACGR